MKHTRIQSMSWSPRSIFVIVLLCCIAFAQAATEVDPRFDSDSRNVAIKWQGIKAMLPHERIPNTSAQIQDTGKWSQSYAIGLVKLVGPGFVIAVLSLLGGLVYGLFKLVRLLLCSSRRDDDSEDDSEPSQKKFTQPKQWVPSFCYVICFVFLLTGMSFGILNNPRFSNGVDDIGDYVVTVGAGAIGLGTELFGAVGLITQLLPISVEGLLDQFSGVDPLADEVGDLSNNVNSTSAQVNDITNKIAAIDAGNTSVVAQLYSQLTGIDNSSQQIISQVSDLTYQISDKLRTSFNSTVGTLDSKMGAINQTVAALVSSAGGMMTQATNLVKTAVSYVNQGKAFDQKRTTAVKALFAVAIVVMFAIVVGFVMKIKVMFNVVAAFSVVLLFMLWFSGSIHFLLGMVLFDVCPVIDPVVQGMLPPTTPTGVILQGCLYKGETVLEAMNLTAYNLSAVFDYKTEFQSFASFSQNFNFSSVNGYFDSIQGLYAYNLTAVAMNLTVASFGWNQSFIYDALDALNNQTSPDYFDLSNYTTAVPSNYPPPRNQTVYDAQIEITDLLTLNATIYNKTATAQQQLIDAQLDIDALLANMTQFEASYDNIKTEVVQLQTKNISNCIAILNNLQSNITAFFHKGNCSFLAEAYQGIRHSLCDTMQPAIDLLTVAQFVAGLALIPMAILAEVLSFRIPKCTNRVTPGGYSEESGGDSSHASKKKSDYTKAATDSPGAPRRTGGITATIGTSPYSYTDSNSQDAPERQQQNYVLPPLKNGRYNKSAAVVVE